MRVYNIKLNGGLVLKIIIFLLSLFMLIVFLFSVYRIFFSSGKFFVKDKITAEEVTEIEPENYTNILQAVHEDLDSYVGLKIKFTGYVYRIIDFDEDQFVLARDMVINDEGTQTVIVGFLCNYSGINQFQDGTWIEITGTIKKGKYHNEEIPIINVEKIKEAEEPEEPFVPIPDNTYIPTSGIL